ncbi:hypothetical protein EDEG_00148 [Edhazardia aedis USNM 41457]|uniref:Uncharacterized protein n=1 Tax=Edhazardia aedis (strain USNM 41457) TaxID=1003232 RepID=J9DSD9_EDHAE|nr:hypothetical protein EDEG_00148 [Edhazardia aedis USNM 41457]|eukprot:EJW04232.1 hypothetical protein EDEG_00148 [Edhazardia aedis USNM 41457]
MFFSTRNTSILKTLYIKNKKKMCYLLQSVIYCLLRFYNNIGLMCEFIQEYFKNLSDFDSEIENIPFLFLYSRMKCLDILSVLSNSKLQAVKMFIYKNSFLFERHIMSTNPPKNLLYNIDNNIQYINNLANVEVNCDSFVNSNFTDTSKSGSNIDEINHLINQ